MEMTEEKKPWNQETFDQTMKESKNELEELKTQLQNLMVRFGMRALKTYQAARNEPLRPMEVKSLVKYEVDSAIADLSEPKSKNAIIEQTTIEWEKQKAK
jgi:hypothetical protein